MSISFFEITKFGVFYSVIKTVVKMFGKKTLLMSIASMAFSPKCLDLYNHFRCLNCAEYRLHLCIWVFALSSEGLTDPALISLLISCGFVS